MNRFIDIKPSRCIGCSSCRAACSEGHAKAGFQDEPRLMIADSRTVVASMTCHHCEGAPCYRVCPTNALRKDDDGCIRCDEVHCIGCKMCAIACPFGAIHMSGTTKAGAAGTEYATPLFPPNVDPILKWEVGLFPVAVKCDLCEYNDYIPKCVEACVTDALTLVELNENDPAYLAKKRRQVQAEEIMFENIDQAIPEGIQNLGTRIAAQEYIVEASRANADYIKGLEELGLAPEDAQAATAAKGVRIPFNGAVASAAANGLSSDAVKAVEDAQREYYLRQIEEIPAHERGVQVDTDNVIDQLSVGVTAPDMSAHATAYKLALDLQEAGKKARVDATKGIEDMLSGYELLIGDDGIESDPKPPEEPKVIHGDQVEYNSGKPDDPAITEQSPVDSPTDVENDIY